MAPVRKFGSREGYSYKRNSLMLPPAGTPLSTIVCCVVNSDEILENATALIVIQVSVDIESSAQSSQLTQSR